MGSGEDIGIDMSGKVEGWVREKVKEWLDEARTTIKEVQRIAHSEQSEVIKARMDLVLARWKELESGFRGWIETE